MAPLTIRSIPSFVIFILLPISALAMVLAIIRIIISTRASITRSTVAAVVIMFPTSSVPIVIFTTPAAFLIAVSSLTAISVTITPRW
uniref:Uncharacterized protein n=1 Tax=Arundo donax TaxID=35708 RepID=A0A0A9A740_ARUDO